MLVKLVEAVGIFSRGRGAAIRALDGTTETGEWLLLAPSTEDGEKSRGVSLLLRFWDLTRI